jgi:hypothetical protein
MLPAVGNTFYFPFFSAREPGGLRGGPFLPRSSPVNQSVFKNRPFIFVTRHGIAPKVRSRCAYNASRMASSSLRATAFLPISGEDDLDAPDLIAPISVSRNSIVRQRSPSRRRCRCVRMRSAAAEWVEGAAVGETVVVGSSSRFDIFQFPFRFNPGTNRGTVENGA